MWPAPMFKCPTSELPICPSGKPTDGPLACNIECGYLLVGLLGARQSVTIFTLVLSFGFGYLMKIIYKIMKIVLFIYIIIRLI